MKKIIFLLAAVLLCTAPLYAQTPPASQAIPELQEWWRAPADEKGLGRYGVSHIPNFYHGKDAMGVSINNGQMETWLNRFPGDRENVFTWKGGGPVLRGDFNGDGLTDYYAGGYVYRGIKNGEMPDSVPVFYKLMVSDKVMDVNHDGYDDIISVADEGVIDNRIALITYGAADFKNMKLVEIRRAAPMDSSVFGEQMFMGSDGNLRFLMFSYNQPKDNRRDFNGYVLFRAKWKTGDTLPTYEKLAEAIRYRDTDIPFQRGGAVYQSKYHSNSYFIVREALGMFNFNVLIYDMSKDMFEQKLKFRMDYAYAVTPLNHSIDSDKYEDWVIRQYGGQSTTLHFFSGKLPLDSIAFATYKPLCDNPPIAISSISDISGDSIADVAVAIQPLNMPNCFMIIKGFTQSSDVVELDVQPSPNQIDMIPHPVKRTSPLTLRITVSNPSLYYLEAVSTDGQRIQEQELGFLATGMNTVRVASELLQGTSVQLVILRLLDRQKHIVGQRTIIIE